MTEPDQPVSEHRQQYRPHPVVIADYDSGWPKVFLNETQLLQNATAGVLDPIEHVGSTSVPNLAAKPVIDIMGGVKSPDEADTLIDAIVGAGYQYVPAYEDSIPDRRYFRKPNRKERLSALFHLHVSPVDSDFWVKQIAFRDYLRTHSATKSNYEALKRRLASQYGEDRHGYSEAKTEFILSVLKLATSERHS